ncbi:protein belonging to Uncharacterized protein family UPF0324 [Rhodopirellula maiorica SM1]|uniref:Protein belonging to Uncharacterized protein family UPF0324 n=1 Tax=Rhodopirellula maiorica SM1 TaxID=1265738 RepID=M5RTX9_9BACT|nr:protein belonging to Uncharacterized protein family UPF0324 [Rhodopirellula maiorica SM1]
MTSRSSSSVTPHNESPDVQSVDGESTIATPPPRPSLWKDMSTNEDWWAIWCAGLLLIVAFAAVWFGQGENLSQRIAAGESVSVTSPLKPYIAKPGKWTDNPLDAIASSWQGILGAFLIIASLFAVANQMRGKSASAFLAAFPVVFLLATLAYWMSGQSVVKAYNLEYALWALLVGLIISNTVGTPNFLRPAISTEFFIKTGLVLLGAEVLMSRLLALGLPGVFVAWLVTPVVLITTYWFGQKVLKIKSKSLNMVISADMSVCGVSAAIATAAACKAKKEELSLSIGLSLGFTVIMMAVMPAVIIGFGNGSHLGWCVAGRNDRCYRRGSCCRCGAGRRSPRSCCDGEDDPKHFDRGDRVLRGDLLGDFCRTRSSGPQDRNLRNLVSFSKICAWLRLDVDSVFGAIFLVVWWTGTDQRDDRRVDQNASRMVLLSGVCQHRTGNQLPPTAAPAQRRQATCAVRVRPIAEHHLDVGDGLLDVQSRLC